MPNTCFDRGDFVIPAHDAEGHTARLTLDIHPGQDRMLDYIVAAQQNGFQTKEALLRWCVCWAIYTLFGPIPNSVSLAEAKLNVFQDERFEQQKDCLSVSVDKYLGAGNVEMARRTVSLSCDDYSRISCEYWRARWLSTLQEPIEQLQKLGVRINIKKPI